MELRIRDNNNILEAAFGYWLIPHIRVKLLSSIKDFNLKLWDDYLNNSTKISRMYNKTYKAEDIIEFASRHIDCKCSYSGEICIQFDSNVFVPGFDRLSLTTILKTINYGTLDIKACPIFTSTFNYFATNINTYVSMYYMI